MSVHFIHNTVKQNSVLINVINTFWKLCHLGTVSAVNFFQFKHGSWSFTVSGFKAVFVKVWIIIIIIHLSILMAPLFAEYTGHTLFSLWVFFVSIPPSKGAGLKLREPPQVGRHILINMAHLGWNLEASYQQSEASSLSGWPLGMNTDLKLQVESRA